MPHPNEPIKDPMIRDLVRLRRQSIELSRRGVLRGAAGLGTAAFLAACGTKAASNGTPSVAGPTSAAPSTGGPSTSTPSSSAPTGPAAATDNSATDKTVAWANWTLYLDYDDKTKKYPTLEAFQKESGLKATYSEDIDGNDTYIGKVGEQLKRGQDIKRDIITLTDWEAARLVRDGWVQKLDQANIPNGKNLRPQLQQVDWDPGRNYSYTWQSGFGVIAWNKEKVPGGLKSVSDLWNPKLKGGVEVLDEMRDTMGLIMLDQGVDISGAFTADDFDKAIEVLQKQIDSGQIRQVKGNSYKEDLISGDAIAVIGWSGDIFQINAENGNKWGFALPTGGGTYWSDNLMVPVGSHHKTNAEKLINYYYDPTVAATVEAYVNYVCPVVGAQEAMAKIDKSLAASPWIFPDDTFLKDSKMFRTLQPDEDTDFSNKFADAIGL